MNTIILQGEYDSLIKRLDHVERLLEWLRIKGRQFTRTASELADEQGDIIRRLLQIEDLSAYDFID